VRFKPIYNNNNNFFLSLVNYKLKIILRRTRSKVLYRNMKLLIYFKSTRPNYGSDWQGQKVNL